MNRKYFLLINLSLFIRSSKLSTTQFMYLKTSKLRSRLTFAQNEMIAISIDQFRSQNFVEQKPSQNNYRRLFKIILQSSYSDKKYVGSALSWFINFVSNNYYSYLFMFNRSNVLFVIPDLFCAIFRRIILQMFQLVDNFNRQM